MRKLKRKLTIYQYIIEKFIKDSQAILKDLKATKREMDVTKNLLGKFSDKKFWFILNKPFDYMESLLWFQTPHGKKYLLMEWNKYKLDLRPEREYPLSSRKAGRSKKIKPKKNLLDFLRDGSKEKE